MRVGVVIGWLLGAVSVFAQPGAPREHRHQVDRVKVVAEMLRSTYDVKTGLFRGTGWWNSANGITALANASRSLHTRKFDGIFSNTFEAAQHHAPGFLNEFYDDEGWWALAWLDVYALHHEVRYLKMSESIFADMTGGWNDSCGGGLWWKKNEHYKNAIANELFLSVAVRLAEVSDGEGRRQYIDWAQKEERWFLASGMINGDSLVNDGLDASCGNNHGTAWTYNQGVVLTGLLGLQQLTGDPEANAVAERIATATGAKLTDENGVLHDACEPQCGADGVQFKGILMRNLPAMGATTAAADVRRLIETNANSVWAHARTSKGQFSVVWSGPPEDGGTGSLIAALDALTAGSVAAPVSASGPS